MIVFDLACAQGHVFEAWFGSQEDYVEQNGRGLVSCPLCGDVGIGKAPMAPRIASSSSGGSGDIAPADARRMMAAMMAAQRQALKGSEDVGSNFASEARAIHEGDAEERRIHGQATLAEAKGLVANGVPVAPLPFPVRPPGTEN